MECNSRWKLSANNNVFFGSFNELESFENFKELLLLERNLNAQDYIRNNLEPAPHIAAVTTVVYS